MVTSVQGEPVKWSHWPYDSSAKECVLIESDHFTDRTLKSKVSEGLR